MERLRGLLHRCRDQVASRRAMRRQRQAAKMPQTKPPEVPWSSGMTGGGGVG